MCLLPVYPPRWLRLMIKCSNCPKKTKFTDGEFWFCPHCLSNDMDNDLEAMKHIYCSGECRDEHFENFHKYECPGPKCELKPLRPVGAAKETSGDSGPARK